MRTPLVVHVNVLQAPSRGDFVELGCCFLGFCDIPDVLAGRDSLAGRDGRHIDDGCDVSSRPQSVQLDRSVVGTRSQVS